LNVSRLKLTSPSQSPRKPKRVDELKETVDQALTTDDKATAKADKANKTLQENEEKYTHLSRRVDKKVEAIRSWLETKYKMLLHEAGIESYAFSWEDVVAEARPQFPKLDTSWISMDEEEGATSVPPPIFAKPKKIALEPII